MGQHLKKIEKPFIIEILDERFDNISTMLTDNAVIYGSSITSIISGLKAEGDLDISVSHIEFLTLCKRFANSSKWKQVSGKKIKETDFNTRKFSTPTFNSATRPGIRVPARPPAYSTKPYSTKQSTFEIEKRSIGRLMESSYRNVSNVSNTVTFETIGGKNVQIVQAKEKSNNPLNDALSVVRAVDFVFCGIAINKYGEILEVIKSALDDCANKIIRVANYHSGLSERFDKYVKRGWNLAISIDRANENYLKIRKNESKNKQLITSKYVEIKHNKKTGAPQLGFLPIMLKKMGYDNLNCLINSTANKVFGVYLKQIGTPKEMIYAENEMKKGCILTEDTAHQICNRVVSTFKTEYEVKKKRKFLSRGDYSESELTSKDFSHSHHGLAEERHRPIQKYKSFDVEARYNKRFKPDKVADPDESVWSTTIATQTATKKYSRKPYNDKKVLINPADAIKEAAEIVYKNELVDQKISNWYSDRVEAYEKRAFKKGGSNNE